MISTYAEHQGNDAKVDLETELLQIDLGVLLVTVLVQVLPGIIDALGASGIGPGGLLGDLERLAALALVGRVVCGSGGHCLC